MTEVSESAIQPGIAEMSSVVDSEIATLASVLDPQELGKQLNALPDLRMRWGNLRDVNFRLLKWHKGERCTLGIMLRTDSEGHEVIAKIYAKDRPDVYQAMDGLWLAGFNRSAEFSIPQPVAYVTSLRLLLQEKVEGLKVKEIFLKGEAKKPAEAAERSARSLAHFHECAPRSGEISPVERELARMECWTRRFSQLGGPLSDRAKVLFERLAQASSGFGEAEPYAGHGSFSPDHVFLVEHRTVTIDWDGFDAGDPARDVARFIVATQRLALGRLHSISSLDAVIEIFLKAYVSARGPGILQRLPFQRAAACLRLANNSAFRHRVRRWEEKVGLMLDEGLRVLPG